jgi:hypothetical protein
MKRQGLNYVDLVQHGVKRTFPGYNIVKMFSPHAFAGNLSKRELKEKEDGGVPETQQLLRKFYRRYPEIKYMPMLGPVELVAGGA